MKYLLTGATGFIGSELLCQLLKAGVSPGDLILLGRSKKLTMDSLLGRRLLEHFENWQAEELLKKIKIYSCDFLDQKDFLKTLEVISAEYPGSFTVLHLAAQVKAPSAEKSAQKRINLGVTEDLSRWSEKNAQHMIFVSSVVAFGIGHNSRVRTEKDFPSFSWLSSQMSYFETKRRAHEKILKASIPAVTVVCPSIVHGSLEEEKSSRGHLRAVREGKLKVIPSGGINIVSLKYVSTHIARLALDLKRKGSETLLLVGENILLPEYLSKYQALHSSHQRVKMRTLPSIFGTALKMIFIGLKLLKIPTSTSFETAVASFGFLFFQSEKLAPDQKVSF